MKKGLTELTKEDFANAPYLGCWSGMEGMDPNDELIFDSFVIIPTGEEHESGYGCMEFALIRDGEILGRIGGATDVVCLDGLGTLGRVITHVWRVDCLPCGYLNLWTREKLFLTDNFVGSTLEVFSKDHGWKAARMVDRKYEEEFGK